MLLTENFDNDGALRFLLLALGHTLVHASVVDVSVVDGECGRGLVIFADADVRSAWLKLLTVGSEPVDVFSISNN